MLALGAGALALATPELGHGAAPASALGRDVAVVTDNADASRAALTVLDQGGSAADGAIAAALALGVTGPAGSGLGGGGFALVYSAKDGTTRAYDFREHAPRAFDAAAFAEHAAAAAGPARAEDAAKTRGQLVGVPGEPAGLAKLSERHGRLALSKVVEPARRLAQDGFFVSRHLAAAIADTKAKVGLSRELSRELLPGGAPVAYAAKVRRPDLARTLARFGQGGRRAFYDGEVAEAIVLAARAHGSAMTAEDLHGYEVVERAPLVRTYGARTVATMPAPSAGGLLLHEVLGTWGAAADSPLAKLGHGSSGYVHAVADAVRGAFADRARVAGDPALEPGVDAAYDKALAPAALAARRAGYVPTKTRPASAFVSRESGTSHLVVVDREGNVVSLTTTVNSGFGAAVVAGDTGVLLNDELDDFFLPSDRWGAPGAKPAPSPLAAPPASPAAAAPGAGAAKPATASPNRPRALARPVSSMTPTIVLEGGVPTFVVGGSGGPRIATGVAQVVLARLVFGADPMAAVSAPRFHAGFGKVLYVDPDVPEDVRAGLARRGETVETEPFTKSGMHAVAIEREGGAVRLLAGADPRKGGFALAR